MISNSRSSQRMYNESEASDTQDQQFIYKNGDIINEKYEVIEILGEGGFGRVHKVRHIESGEFMALKMIMKGLGNASEIRILQTIAQLDNNNLCIKLLDAFEDRGHQCMVFELLGESIASYQENDNSFTLKQIRHISYQLCQAVKLLHDNNITHADIKPENIMFVDATTTEMNSTKIRLIDFGLAAYDHERGREIVATPVYSAPEVMLNLGWSQARDVWSIGCTLFELYTARLLFDTFCDRDHLARMERILGPFPKQMAIRYELQNEKKLFENGKLIRTEGRSRARFGRNKVKKLHRYRLSNDADHVEFFDLLKNMLKIDPKKRVTLRQALEHPFFKNLPQEQRLRIRTKLRKC